MKKYIVLFTILLGSGFMASAQEEQPADEVKKQERIKALYVAYVSNHLELNPEEAQKFWPLHTQFETELKAVKPDLPELEKQQAILNIKKKYQESFNRIVGPNVVSGFSDWTGNSNTNCSKRSGCIAPTRVFDQS